MRIAHEASHDAAAAAPISELSLAFVRWMEVEAAIAFAFCRLVEPRAVRRELSAAAAGWRRRTRRLVDVAA